MPDTLSLDKKTRVIDAWVTGCFDEFIDEIYPTSHPQQQHSQCIQRKRLEILKMLCLADDPATFIIKHKIFDALTSCYSFLAVFLNPVENLLRQDQELTAALNAPIIFFARAKLCSLVAKKLRTLSGGILTQAENNWLTSTHKKIETEYKALSADNQQSATLKERLKIWCGAACIIASEYTVFSLLEAFRDLPMLHGTLETVSPYRPNLFLLHGMQQMSYLLTLFCAYSITSTQRLYTNPLPALKYDIDFMAEDITPIACHQTPNKR